MHELQQNAGLKGQKINFINAFNTVKRDTLLKECYNNFPQIYSWVHFCYSKHSFLFFGDFIISSEAGVQQGDPLGPFLFCLVLQVLINALVKATPNFVASQLVHGRSKYCGKQKKKTSFAALFFSYRPSAGAAPWSVLKVWNF